MTTYAARHLALGGDDSEPEGLASAWGEGPAPRHALPPEDAATSYEPYVPEPTLVPFTAVASQDLPNQAATPSEFGPPVVASALSQTMKWHLSGASLAPRDPGPAHATAPVGIDAPIDPASYPTPVSHFATVSYQSMESPAYAASVATPYRAPRPESYLQAPHAFGAVDGDSPETPVVAGAAVVKVAVTVQRVMALVILAVVLATFTAVGIGIGGQAWWIVGFAWLMGILMLVGILSPGQSRLRWSGLK
jgi:hypothetical protein